MTTVKLSHHWDTTTATTTMSDKTLLLLRLLRDDIVPKLGPSLHKGSLGRIGVVGGSEIYTGAPYYAAMAALKTGADLAYIYCDRSAAPILKSYSPELIVFPALGPEPDPPLREAIFGSVERLSAIVVGPGLSKGNHTITRAALELLGHAIEPKPVIPSSSFSSRCCVIDADGLELLSHYRKPAHLTPFTVLTPNLRELDTLCRIYDIDSQGRQPEDKVAMLQTRLGPSIGILAKGPSDLIAIGREILIGSHPGSHRRCGGQGDILSGVLAVLLTWTRQSLARRYPDRQDWNEADDDYVTAMQAAMYGASCLVREASRRMFESKGRAMTSPDILLNLGEVFASLFESPAG